MKTNINKITEVYKVERGDPRAYDEKIKVYRHKGKRFLKRLRNGFSFNYFRFVFLLNIENKLGYTTYDIEENMSKIPGYIQGLYAKFRRKDPFKDYTLDNMEWSNVEDVSFNRFVNMDVDYEFYANIPLTWFEFKIIFQKHRMLSREFVAYTFKTLHNDANHNYTLFIHEKYQYKKDEILSNFLKRYNVYFSKTIDMNDIEFSDDIRPILDLSMTVNKQQHREDLSYLYGKVIHNPDDKAHPYVVISELTEDEYNERYKSREHWKFRVLKCECMNCGEILYQPYPAFLRNKLVKCERCYNIGNNKRSKLMSIAGGIVERCRNVKSSIFYKYGGRGIRCELGKTASEVAKSLEKVPGFNRGLQIDRIDNDGNYTLYHPIHKRKIWYDEKGRPCRGNLRWVDRHSNSTNTIFQQELGIEDFSLRLMKEMTFTRKCLSMGINPNNFVRYYFSEIEDKRFKDAVHSVYLFIHKSFIKNEKQYINRIIKFYREFDKNKLFKLDNSTIIKEEYWFK